MCSSTAQTHLTTRTEQLPDQDTEHWAHFNLSIQDAPCMGKSSAAGCSTLNQRHSKALHAHVLTRSCGLQVTPPFVRLHEQATEAPLQWAPVLAMLIHNHCHHIPHSAYTHWLQALHSHRFEDAPEPAATLWLLRYVHELAVAWPAALTAAEDSFDAASGDDTSTRLLESHWKVLAFRILDSARHDHPCCVYSYTLTKGEALAARVCTLPKFGLCSGAWYSTVNN